MSFAFTAPTVTATGNVATRQMSASRSFAPAGCTWAVSNDGVVRTPSTSPWLLAHRMSSSFADAMKILIRLADTGREGTAHDRERGRAGARAVTRRRSRLRRGAD